MRRPDNAPRAGWSFIKEAPDLGKAAAVDRDEPDKPIAAM
jgi:hypothetical protein